MFLGRRELEAVYVFSLIGSAALLIAGTALPSSYKWLRRCGAALFAITLPVGVWSWYRLSVVSANNLL